VCDSPVNFSPEVHLIRKGIRPQREKVVRENKTGARQPKKKMSGTKDAPMVITKIGRKVRTAGLTQGKEDQRDGNLRGPKDPWDCSRPHRMRLRDKLKKTHVEGRAHRAPKTTKKNQRKVSNVYVGDPDKKKS